MKINKIFMTLLLFLLCATNLAMAAPPETISPDELYRGMRGYGKTVIKGTEIETFSVEVIDVMKNSGATGGDLILVRVYGNVIDRSGGVAQGMSGSPVFFDGRLAGAVAFGWSLSQPDVCMLTPIGEMLKISDDMRADLEEKPRLLDEKANKEAFALANIFEREKDKDKAESDDKSKENEKEDKTEAVANEESEITEEVKADISIEEEPDSLLAMLPKGTPIMAVGFSEKGLGLLKSDLREFEMVPYSVGNVPYSMSDVALEPGSAVSVELIRGDLSLGVLGTVTWVDGDEVLAFGHPFTKRGRINYFMSNAYTFTTISSINSPFKIGAPGKLLGVALQDRGSGVAGKMNVYPDVIPMLITVNDNVRNMNKVYAVQILQNDLLTPALAQAAVVSLVDRTIDRTGEGTAKVSFTIRGFHEDMPDNRELRRSNMFYSTSNVSEILASEMATGVYFLKRNRFKSVYITDVHVKVEVSGKRDTATILSAKPLVSKVKPGDALGIEVTLLPYHGENITRIANFIVPKEQKAGQLVLSVRGGTSLVSLQNVVNRQNAAEMAVLLREDSSKYVTFADEIDSFNKKDRNNDIVVDLFPVLANNSKKKQKDVVQQQREQEQQIKEFVQGTKYKTNTQAPYIITGETSTIVEVLDSDEGK